MCVCLCVCCCSSGSGVFGVKGNNRASHILITRCINCKGFLGDLTSWEVAETLPGADDRSRSKCPNAAERRFRGLPLVPPYSPRKTSLLKTGVYCFLQLYLKKDTRFKGSWLTSHVCVAGWMFNRSLRGRPLLTSSDFFFPWSHDIFHWDQGAVIKKKKIERIKDIPFLAYSERALRLPGPETHSAADYHYQLGGINNTLCSIFSRKKEAGQNVSSLFPFQEVTLRPWEYYVGWSIRPLAPKGSTAATLMDYSRYSAIKLDPAGH